MKHNKRTGAVLFFLGLACELGSEAAFPPLRELAYINPVAPVMYTLLFVQVYLPLLAWFFVTAGAMVLLMSGISLARAVRVVLAAAGIAGMVDTDSLQAQLADAMGSYMNEMMGQYGVSVGQAIENQMASVMEQMMTQISAGIQQYMQQAMAQLAQNLGGAMNLSPEAFEQAFQVNMDGEELAQILLSMGSIQDATYEGNLQSLGYADTDVPSEIDIYPKDFESKEQVTAILEDYNRQMEEQGKEDQVISYTDSVGTLMSSVTDIVNVISYVLIAFVAISLLVSSIMIGVITYISVLERKKEIGILRAIGASKKNVSQVFNAETFIIGACAGILGIAITLILLIPGNMILHSLDGLEDITAKLPVYDALLLIGISILLTLIGGLIPSRKASKSDPVTALRVD